MYNRSCFLLNNVTRRRSTHDVRFMTIHQYAFVYKCSALTSTALPPPRLNVQLTLSGEKVNLSTAPYTLKIYYAGWRSQPASWIRERIPFVFLGVKNCLLFLTFPYPMAHARPEKLCDFYWLQLQITCKSGWIAQGEKRNCVSKAGKSKLY